MCSSFDNCLDTPTTSPRAVNVLVQPAGRNLAFNQGLPFAHFNMMSTSFLKRFLTALDSNDGKTLLFSSVTLLSTLSVRSRSADCSKRLDNNRNFGTEYYAVGKKTRIVFR